MGEPTYRSGRATSRLVVVIVLVVAAIVAGLLVWQPWAGGAAELSTAGQDTSETGVTARAEFPTSPESRADVRIIETTGAMVDAAPASFTNLATASFEMVTGEFPKDGAKISFDLSSPAADDHGVIIAHWNEQQGMWEPIETQLSADRLHASATVLHFSPYSLVDYSFNEVNKVLGNAAPSGVTCDSPVPDWADPQYFDDINGPVLWCGGKDTNNAEILVAKLKMNRASAALISTAVKPAWVWSDLWDNMGPETMLQMASTAAMGTPKQLVDGYVVQPLGEYNFGFARSDLEAFYADGRWDKPLVEVSLGWVYTLFGALYDEMKDRAGGNIAGAVAMLALGQCSFDLASAPSAESAARQVGSVMACIESSAAALEKGALTFVTKKIPANDQVRRAARTGLSNLRMIAKKFAYLSATTRLFTTIGDLSLPDITRQFLYRPSISAIKAAVEKKKSGNGATRFVTLDPWRDGTLTNVADIHDSAGKEGESCTGSGIAPRKDGFRCFAAGIYDPCFQSPTSRSDFLCMFWSEGERQVTRIRNIQPKTKTSSLAPEDSAIVMAELTDGTICRRATGAGPQGVPGYPYWTGVCTGASGGVWRVGEAVTWKTSGYTYPLYPPEKAGGYHRAAISIGTETAPAQLVDVKTAYR